jgi:hypothetical protein
MSTHPPRRTSSEPVYSFHCPTCRRLVMVHPNQAGSRLDCRCGAQNLVPNIMQLQRVDQPPAPANQPPLPGPGPTPPGTAPAGPFAAPPCPFCHAPLQAGRIIGERYQLKWLDINTPLTLGIWAVGGLPIGRGGFMQFNRPHVYGWRCARCCKIIVDERA